MKKLTLLALFVLSLTRLHAQSGTPAEQRKWAVDTAHWIEQHPLDKDVKARGTELLKWWTEVPDLTLTVCPLLLETKNKKIAPTVVTQAIFAAGADLIEHPDATSEDHAVAAVQSALRSYAIAIAENPHMRDAFLDDLARADAEGKLREVYVHGVMAKCEAERSK